MARDYYAILGVERGASTAEIKKAYRRLARKFHPDVNPGDKSVEEKFKEISEAYAVLADPAKRKAYDQAGRAPAGGGDGPFTNPPAGAGEGMPFDFSSMYGGGGFEDLFSQVFGRRREESPKPPPQGQSLTEEITIDFKEAVLGGSVLLDVKRKKECSACSGRGNRQGRVCSTCHGTGMVVETEKVRVRIPEGVDDGSTIRLAGKGNPNPYGGAPGDLFITLRVKPHFYFQRRGNDIYTEVPLTLQEAYGGAEIEIPTVHGKVRIKVPPRTQTGQLFRLKGKGIRNVKTGTYGDHYYRVKVVLPDKESELAKDLVKRLGEYYSFNVRAGLPEGL
jgi:molecular chaperone DnaJ